MHVYASLYEKIAVSGKNSETDCISEDRERLVLIRQRLLYTLN